MLHLFKSIFRPSESSSSKYDDEVIDWAIEKLVDGTDSRLRLISGYKRKLWDCVERSVSFVDEIGESLPPPLAIDPSAFTADHAIRTWFGTVRKLHEAFSLNQSVQHFVEKPENASLEQFYAGMSALIDQKTVLIPELRGEMIQREVSRTAFSFANHAVVAPAATEEALRVEVKERIYMNLVERALARLVANKHQQRELEKQRTLLRSKLRAIEKGRLGMQPFVAASGTESDNGATLEERLDEIETKLGFEAGRSDALWKTDMLDRNLSNIIEVMNNPEKQFSVTPGSVRVTQMGFLAGEEADEKFEEVEYTKIKAGDSGEFAVRLVTFPVKGLTPPEEFRPRFYR